MSKYKVPIKKPKPDIDEFLKIMNGESSIKRVPLVEYVVDDVVMKPILEEMIGRKWVDISNETGVLSNKTKFSKDNLELLHSWLDNIIAFWHHMGYDFVRIEIIPPYPGINSFEAFDTTNRSKNSKRNWQDSMHGPIKNWEDFENYNWPEITDDDFYIHKYICENLPEGMGFISCHAGGVYEHAARLFGYEKLCINLIDNPKLVEAVIDKVGEIIMKYNEYLLGLDKLVAILQGEDLGFNTQTLISPQDIRKYVLPWHKKFADQIHNHDKYYYIHSCGKIDCIMEDLINYVEIDGKHSFMEKVAPIEKYKELYGNRICLLGGIDVDILARSEINDLKKYVRKVIDICAPGGRFALGAGNSIPSYVPVENYLAMVNEVFNI